MCADLFYKIFDIIGDWLYILIHLLTIFVEGHVANHVPSIKTGALKDFSTRSHYRAQFSRQKILSSLLNNLKT